MSIVLALAAGLVASIIPVCMVSIAYDVQEINKEIQKIRKTKEGDSK